MRCHGVGGRSNTVLYDPGEFKSFLLLLSLSYYTQRCVRSLADRAGLDYAVPWHGQPKEIVGRIIGAVSAPQHPSPPPILIDHMFQARERHSFLNRFPHGWPVEEFLKTYLKNKRAYARKRGYLKENTNQRQGRHDDDDEEEEDGRDDDDEEQEEQEQEEQEQEENGWNRGNGWGNDFEGDDVPA